MALVMIEVADLEVLEKIKKVEASFTWPHPTEQGYFVNAAFVRTEKNIPYLLYCPQCKTDLRLTEILLNDDLHWVRPEPIRNYELTSGFVADLVGVQFYLFPLTIPKPEEIKKADIEKLFGVKVV